MGFLEMWAWFSCHPIFVKFLSPKMYLSVEHDYLNAPPIDVLAPTPYDPPILGAMVYMAWLLALLSRLCSADRRK
jgi:hypothetical protein